MRVLNKVAIVTGGGSRIGHTMAGPLVEEGDGPGTALDSGLFRRPGLILRDGSARYMAKIGTTSEEFDARSEVFVCRSGRPRGLVAAVLFPASDEASYTGSQLTVDGGYSAQ